MREGELSYSDIVDVLTVLGAPLLSLQELNSKWWIRVPC